MTKTATTDTAPPHAGHRPRRDLTRTRLTGFALIACLLALWEMSARLGWVVSDNWPAVTAILRSMVQALASGELPEVLLTTAYRMLAGYAIGCALGVGLGIMLGTNRLLDALVRPVLEVLRTLPLPAILPPLILFLGVDDALKIFVVALAAFFPVFVNAYSGVQSVDPTLVLTARTFRLKRSAVLSKVILPAILPAVMAGMRTSISIALISAVIAEMVSGASGIGNYLMTMQYAMRASTMYAAVICLAALGYLLNRAFLAIERRILFWR